VTGPFIPGPHLCCAHGELGKIVFHLLNGAFPGGCRDRSRLLGEERVGGVLKVYAYYSSIVCII